MSIARRRPQQRGSALLIVFVFAAALAIMLYREMPVVAFEAQRQKEQLLADRGAEYKRAIKLYVRKFQTFPASFEALENTNRMRFLRNRYVDPYSGKADWRLLHAGPGGIIIDSKIKAKTNPLNGASNSSDANSSAANANNANSNNATSNANAASTDPNALLNGPSAANAFPQRPPAVSLDGSNIQTTPSLPMPGMSQGQQTDPQQTPPVPTAGAPYPGYPSPIPGQGNNPVVLGPDGNPLPILRPGRARNTAVPGDPNAAGNSANGSMGNSQDPQSMMQTLVNNTNPQPNAQTGITASSGNPMTAGTATGAFNGAMNQGNNTMGGGIAGVASKAAGRTIKVINDQTDRALWEFVYDMQKELMANAPGMGNRQTNGQTGASGQNGASSGFGTSSSFNSPSQTNTFGSSSFGSSGNTAPPAFPQQSPTNQ